MATAVPLGGPPRISLLLSDVDGTLVTKTKRLSERTIAAIGKLRRAKIAFAITSSRPPAGLKHLIEPLGLTTPIAGFNGGMIVDRLGNVIRKLTLAPEAAQRAVTLLAEHDIDIWVFNGNDWLVTHPHGDYVALEQATIHYAPTIVRDFTPALGGVTKIVGSSRHPKRLKRAEAALKLALAGRASVSLSQSYYLDITHERANKGTAVLALSEILLIPSSEIATIGDMENDVRMFEASGFPIAMGNASPEVQARARAVTLTNEQDGFAEAVERYILPRAPVMGDASRNG
jgi:Cof subfamily protein (haloacid dehalogenase superfamily)